MQPANKNAEYFNLFSKIQYYKSTIWKYLQGQHGLDIHSSVCVTEHSSSPKKKQMISDIT
jgi:hypothetical protein